HKIRELYEISDIGIDQVLYGWHGKVSVELMALGKPVVCYIDPELLKYRPELPIVSATPTTLTSELEKLIANESSDGKLAFDLSRTLQNIMTLNVSLMSC